MGQDHRSCSIYKKGAKMIREINTAEIISTVKEMCIEANHFLSEDMDSALKKATAE